MNPMGLGRVELPLLKHVALFTGITPINTTYDMPTSVTRFDARKIPSPPALAKNLCLPIVSDNRKEMGYLPLTPPI